MIKAACLVEGDNMSSGTDRSRYLSLALDARRAINAIRTVESKGTNLQELRHSIGAAAASLEAANSGADLYAHLAPGQCAPYRDSDELRAVVEASTAFSSDTLIPSLKSLLKSDEPAVSDLEIARKFFRALERRALHQYNDPMSPEGMTS
jgi:hypothetical protein